MTDTKHTPTRTRVCGNCAHFTPLNPDDDTAPEGKCSLAKWPGSWPMGYWPAMLKQDFCGKFNSRAALAKAQEGA